MRHQVTLSQAFQVLEKSEQEFKVLFETGTLSLELYKPDTIDKQKPHERDEIYLIASGQGKFNLEGEITSVKTGDFLFVPAGAAHKFFEFTTDFSTWVLFYGPAGGEKGTLNNYLV